jgi:hypothetical protein
MKTASAGTHTRTNTKFVVLITQLSQDHAYTR